MDSINMIALVAGLVLGLLYLIYRSTFPKPLPGIPFSKLSIRAFGDLPDLLEIQARTKQGINVLLVRGKELGAPVFQAFLEPIGGQPVVVVTDPVLTEDILRRPREFDASPFFTGLFKGLAPHNMVTYQAKDPRWKQNRRLMADTMSPSFLNTVASAQITDAIRDLVSLWDQKIRLGNGHLFNGPTNYYNGAGDVDDMMMEGIFAVAFGESNGVTKADIKTLAEIQQLPIPSDTGIPMTFPLAARPDSFLALQDLSESVAIPLNSPLGTLHHKVALQLYPKLRRAVAWKRKYIRQRLTDAWERFSREASEDDIKCASDLLVAREVTLAAKEGRKPEYDTDTTRDELYGFIQAGSDTTATTLQWTLKYLMTETEVQQKLRDSLRAVFGTQSPDGKDVAKADLPYLDAVIEESLRLGSTVNFSFREAQVDCEILGHRIPAKTNVIMAIGGPGYVSPRLSIKSDLKNPWTGNWDPELLEQFLPERWLVTVEGGRTKFDTTAGPQHNFGAGLKSCFGKRLALLGLRIMLTTLVLNFEFNPVEGKLGDFEGADFLSHRPQRFFARLEKL